MKKFLFTEKKIDKSIASLLEKGFSQNTTCSDGKPSILLIDRKNKNFFLADKEVFIHVNAIVKDKFKKSYKKTSLKKIYNWK
ncbi:hypothetical protein [Flavobacterium sp. FlaQc-50]|uniref:hypothetical protein n=1 Tax=unclassified Flavobacterium TaxID=196869 RepID=UPI003757A334